MTLKICIFFNVKAVRQQSTVKYEMGSVVIENKEINLNCN